MKITNKEIMLTKFSVSNFKSFKTEFIFDLQETKGYEFNRDSIKNGVINNALIYGHNGVGKSNLGFAIFDIVGHLTDKQMDEHQYSSYLNAFNESKTAHFCYEFIFNSRKVIYEYQKLDSKTIFSEKFIIDGNVFASMDRGQSNDAIVNFKGTENLKKNITNSNLSLIKYINNNSELDKNEDNDCFLKFIEFIDGMLFFRSLDKPTYLGLETGSSSLTEDIIKKRNVSDLEKFLNTAGIECKLTVVKESDKDVLAFDFNGKTISIFKIASTGTKSLILFYFWFQRLKDESKVSFLFIDEFDAFYHHKLSALIVEELKKTGIQFILTTHNTSIITNDILRPDCYFLMNKDSIRSLAKSTTKDLREAHNIEKMYKAGSFNG